MAIGRDIYVGCVHMVWGKVEIFIWSCTQGVLKVRDIYVVCVNRVWGKVELFMWGACTWCGEM